MRVFFDLGIIFLACLLLIKACNWIIAGIKDLASKTGFGKMGLASFLIGFATSLPEFFVGVTAALSGKPGLSLGNVLGSNIADIGLVMGAAAIFAGRIRGKEKVLQKDLSLSFLVTLLALVLIWDNFLSRLDGLILILAYLAYDLLVLKPKREKPKENFVAQIYHRFFHRGLIKTYGQLFLGFSLVILLSELVVRFSASAAQKAGVPLFLVGILLVAIGTSLPELVIELETAKKHEDSIAFGNVIGSLAVNAGLVLGVTSLISPIKIANPEEFVISIFFLLLFYIFFYLFSRTKNTLELWEGLFLFLLYFVFVFMEILEF